VNGWWQPRPVRGQSATGNVVFGDIVQVSDVGGDVSVVSRQPPPYRVVLADDRPVPVSVGRAGAQPSRLLLARHQIVAFTGRQATLDSLAAWSAGVEPVAARLIHAPGGQGKTRLAGHVGVLAAAAGWAVWQVTHTPTPTGGSGTVSGADTGEVSRVAVPAGAVLVVVDYADRWPASALLALLTQMRDLHQTVQVRVRVLLLARSDGYWWPAVADRADSAAGTPPRRWSTPARCCPPSPGTSSPPTLGAARRRQHPPRHQPRRDRHRRHVHGDAAGSPPSCHPNCTAGCR
jgi:hypothetical protein